MDTIYWNKDKDMDKDRESDIGGIQIQEVEQFGFIPLADILCDIIAQLNRLGEKSKYETIKRVLFDEYYSCNQQEEQQKQSKLSKQNHADAVSNSNNTKPTEEILLQALNELLKAGAIYKMNENFFVAIPATTPYHAPNLNGDNKRSAKCNAECQTGKSIISSPTAVANQTLIPSQRQNAPRNNNNNKHRKGLFARLFAKKDASTSPSKVAPKQKEPIVFSAQFPPPEWMCNPNLLINNADAKCFKQNPLNTKRHLYECNLAARCKLIRERKPKHKPEFCTFAENLCDEAALVSGDDPASGLDTKRRLCASINHQRFKQRRAERHHLLSSSSECLNYGPIDPPELLPRFADAEIVDDLRRRRRRRRTGGGHGEGRRFRGAALGSAQQEPLPGTVANFGADTQIVGIVANTDTGKTFVADCKTKRRSDLQNVYGGAELKYFDAEERNHQQEEYEDYGIYVNPVAIKNNREKTQPKNVVMRTERNVPKQQLIDEKLGTQCQPEKQQQQQQQQRRRTRRRRRSDWFIATSSSLSSLSLFANNPVTIENPRQISTKNDHIAPKWSVVETKYPPPPPHSRVRHTNKSTKPAPLASLARTSTPITATVERRRDGGSDSAYSLSPVVTDELSAGAVATASSTASSAGAVAMMAAEENSENETAGLNFVSKSVRPPLSSEQKVIAEFRRRADSVGVIGRNCDDYGDDELNERNYENLMHMRRVHYHIDHRAKRSDANAIAVESSPYVYLYRHDPPQQQLTKATTGNEELRDQDRRHVHIENALHYRNHNDSSERNACSQEADLASISLRVRPSLSRRRCGSWSGSDWNTAWTTTNDEWEEGEEQEETGIRGRGQQLSHRYTNGNDMFLSATKRATHNHGAKSKQSKRYSIDANATANVHVNLNALSSNDYCSMQFSRSVDNACSNESLLTSDSEVMVYGDNDGDDCCAAESSNSTNTYDQHTYVNIDNEDEQSTQFEEITQLERLSPTADNTDKEKGKNTDNDLMLKATSTAAINDGERSADKVIRILRYSRHENVETNANQEESEKEDFIKKF
ncbi:unnamed protein product [Anisakis simplex]|uniref:Stork_head domain-containing protein n=1 Tax=Anisakis simplex TaxID=6269 RepID=A0A0M3JUM0_ANISI|nr:unnamed protein product [Anisakis simplex]